MGLAPDYPEQFEVLMDFEGEPDDILRYRQQAIDLAELHRDLPGSLRARLGFIEVGLFESRYEEAVIHFVKCVNICRQYPELLDRYGQLMAVISRSTFGSIVCFAGASREQIDFAAQEMARFYELVGWGKRALHKAHMSAAIKLGDIDQVTIHRERWLAIPNEEGEDCEACQAASLCKSYIASGLLEKALESGVGLLDGHLKCGSEPAGTDAVLLMPLLRAGKVDLAERLQRRSFEKVRTAKACFDDTGRFMSYLTATDQLSRATKMLEAGLSLYPSIRRDWDRFCMLKGTRDLLRRLHKIGRRDIRLRTPPDFEIHRPDHLFSVEILSTWADTQANQLATRFDIRNGNNYCSTILCDCDRMLDTLQIPPEAK